MKNLIRYACAALVLTTAVARADQFRFYDLRATPVDQSHCDWAFTRPAHLVRLGDESAVAITNWNVEGVREQRPRFDALGIDPDANYHAPPDPTPAREVPTWKFAAKQRKLMDAAALAGLTAGTLSHFVVLPEVESIATAEELLNEGPLAGRYRTFLTKGNDARGVDLALAVRADLDVTIEFETHVNARWYDPTEDAVARLFTRDLPVLIIRDGPTNRELLILIGQHAKSMRDRSRGADRKSRGLRSAQLEASARIVRHYQQRFGDDVPIVMAGDFNAEMRTAPEVRPLKRVMSDAFDVVGARERVTQTYHPREDVVVASQLDACLVSDVVRPFVRKALVLPEFDHRTGMRLGQPISREDRERNFASDHRAMVTVLDGALFSARVGQTRAAR